MEHFLDAPVFPGTLAPVHSRIDQAMKRLMRAVLVLGGTFVPQFEVSPDPQNTDGYFVPDPNRTSPILATLLGRMTSTSSALELFWSAPGVDEVSECLRKHMNLRHVVTKNDAAATLPHQWIISSGRPGKALVATHARRAHGWPRGVYRLPAILATSVVVANELPEERSTLLFCG